ncbi:MAG: hypothetical protein IH991_20135 [Planctomycetes bacterium]|nr:hypothetical protein [Planctomycetota bacterium]
MPPPIPPPVIIKAQSPIPPPAQAVLAEADRPGSAHLRPLRFVLAAALLVLPTICGVFVWENTPHRMASLNASSEGSNLEESQNPARENPALVTPVRYSPAAVDVQAPAESGSIGSGAENGESPLSKDQDRHQIASWDSFDKPNPEIDKPNQKTSSEKNVSEPSSRLVPLEKTDTPNLSQIPAEIKSTTPNTTSDHQTQDAEELFSLAPQEAAATCDANRKLGTVIQWMEDPKQAAELAEQQGKLVFMILVSGNFAREEFT